MYWQLTTKGDYRCQLLADRHYSRQQPGMWSFTRPGYNYVLYAQDPNQPTDKPKEAVFVWWRPADGIPRFDSLTCLECTIFRNETTILSSTLITQAISAVQTWEHFVPYLITGISSTKTTRRRSKRSQPGMCFIHAGFTPFNKATQLADTWLHISPPFPEPIIPQRIQPPRIQRPPQPTNSLGLTKSQTTQLYKHLKAKKLMR